jgi:hypothetical protein
MMRDFCYDIPWVDDCIDKQKLYNQFYDLYGYTLVSDCPHPSFNVGDCCYLITLPPSHEWGQSILNELLSITITKIRLFVVKAGKTLDLHKDTIGQTDELRNWAINVPLLNCDEGYNEFYEEEKNAGLVGIYAKENSAITPERKTNWIPSYRTKLNCAKLLNVGKFHSCDNSMNPNDRYVISFRSDNCNTWQEMINRIDYVNTD